MIGFTKSIEPLLERFHKKALILGTGGASKAINYGLKSLGIETVFVSRYERPGTIQYENITPEVIHEYNVIVNCTPCGMFPQLTNVRHYHMRRWMKKNLLYDLLYNPDQTLFMKKKGAEHGATVKNGLKCFLIAGIRQDALIMNTDDLLCVGAVDNIAIVKSTIGPQQNARSGEVISAIINGTDETFGPNA